MALAGRCPQGRPRTRGSILLSVLVALLMLPGTGWAQQSAPTQPARADPDRPGHRGRGEPPDPGAGRPEPRADQDRRSALPGRAPRRRPLHLRSGVLRRRAGSHRGVRGRGARDLRRRRATAPPRGQLRGELGAHATTSSGRRPPSGSACSTTRSRSRRPRRPSARSTRTRGSSVSRSPRAPSARPKATCGSCSGSRKGRSSTSTASSSRGTRRSPRARSRTRCRRRSACTGSSPSRPCSARCSTTTWTASSSSTPTTATSRPAWSPPRSCPTSRGRRSRSASAWWRGRSSTRAPSRSRATRSSRPRRSASSCTLQEGGVFNRGALRNSVRAIVDRYSELGRARAEVEPRTSNDLANLKVDVMHPDRRGRAGLRRADQHQPATRRARRRSCGGSCA